MFVNTEHIYSGFKNLIDGRDVDGDRGRATIKSEAKRKTAAHFFMRIVAGQESLRVLEEFMRKMNVARRG